MPREEPIPRAIRLVHIQNLLYRHPGGLTTAELAKLCGVTVRTIQRDLVALGCPPYNVPVMEIPGHRGYWRLSTDYVPLLSALRLTLPEATALFLAARLLLRASDEHNPYVTGALAKLAAVLPEPIASHIQQTLSSASTHRVSETFVRVFEVVTSGWATRRKVRLWHQSAASANVHEYLVSPYFIEPSAPSYAAYVIGYEEVYFRRVRTFKLERIHRAELTEERYTIPGDFDIASFLTSAWGIMGGEEETEVCLRFSPAATRRVKESLWHPSQVIEDCADGGCILRVWISRPLEMISWIRGWGPAVEVLAPPELRDQMAEEAKRTAEVYGRKGP